jgi:hypothetical protein
MYGKRPIGIDAAIRARPAFWANVGRRIEERDHGLFARASVAA